MFRRILTSAILIVVAILLGCRKTSTKPSVPDVKSPIEYVWTVDSLLYPGSFQTLVSDFWGSSAKDLYAIGHCNLQGGILHHYNGNKWEAINIQNTATGHKDLEGIWGSASNNVWAVGKINVLKKDKTPYYYVDVPLVLQFDGNLWQHVPLPKNVEGGLLDIWGRSSSDIWAVGDSGMVWHYDGSEWFYERIQKVSRIHQVGGTANDVLISARFSDNTGADLDTAVSYVFSGNEWQEVDRQLFGENESNPRFGWWQSHFDIEMALSYSSSVFQWRGNDWEEIFFKPDSVDFISFNDIHGSSANHIIAVGWPPSVMPLFFDGSSWNRIELDIKQQEDINWFPAVWANGRECFIAGYALNGGHTYIIHGK